MLFESLFFFGLLSWIVYMTMMPEVDPGFPAEQGAWDYGDDPE